MQEQVVERPSVSELEHDRPACVGCTQSCGSTLDGRREQSPRQWAAQFVSDVRHDFGLLHRINAQLTLKVLVEFNEIGRIPGVVNNDRNNGSGHLGVVNGRCGRC